MANGYDFMRIMHIWDLSIVYSNRLPRVWYSFLLFKKNYKDFKCYNILYKQII